LAEAVARRVQMLTQANLIIDLISLAVLQAALCYKPIALKGRVYMMSAGLFMVFYASEAKT
jgi:hypothetical protein